MKKILLSLCLMPMLAFAQAVLPTNWSFVTPSPTGASSASPTGPVTTYTDKPGWSTKIDISVTGSTPFAYATGSDGNAACRLDASGEYVQVNIADKADSVVYFLKSWVGGTPSPTQFDGEFRLLESADGTTWSVVKAFTTGQISISKYDRYANKLASSSRYVRFIFVTKLTGINIGLDNVTIQQAAAATTPTLSIKQGATTLINNGSFTFGNLSSRAFTIVNSGTVDTLRIDSIKISGTNASDFTLSNYNKKIAANSQDSFTLNFLPSSNGSRFATITVYGNDPDKNPFTVNLYAIGGQYATEPSQQVPSITVSNVRTQTMNINFGKALAEGYIILRKTGAAINEAPVDGVTYKKGDYIGGAQVAYIGTDTATIRPLYILANTTYAFVQHFHSMAPLAMKITILPTHLLQP